MTPGEVLTHVLIPWTAENEHVAAFKQCHRREDDIALVNACLRAQCEKSDGGQEWHIKEASLVYGGVGPTVVVAKQTAAALAGQRLDEKLVQVHL